MMSLLRTPSSIATRVCCGRQRTARRRSSRASRRERRIGFAAGYAFRTRRQTVFLSLKGTLRAMKLGVHVGYWGLGLTSEDQREIVQEAERRGPAPVGPAEAHGSDAPTILGWIAAQPERIKIGSAIFQMPGRSPAMTAM